MAQMQINIGDHASAMAGYQPIPNQYRETMRWARKKAQWITKNIPRANTYFSGLPGGRTLTQVLADDTIWVNYHPTMSAYGETEFVGGKEIAIANTAFRMGRWTVLATLIHELAHTNGAPGGTDNSAERAVLACGMGRNSEQTSGNDDPWTPYDPDITG